MKVHGKDRRCVNVDPRVTCLYQGEVEHFDPRIFSADCELFASVNSQLHSQTDLNAETLPSRNLAIDDF